MISTIMSIYNSKTTILALLLNILYLIIQINIFPDMMSLKINPNLLSLTYNIFPIPS